MENGANADADMGLEDQPKTVEAPAVAADAAEVLDEEAILIGIFRRAALDHGDNRPCVQEANCINGTGSCLELIIDEHTTVLDLDHTGSTSFFGVYDGHGGANVALYCANRFHTELLRDEDYQNNLDGAVRHVFFRMDEQLREYDEWRALARPRCRRFSFNLLNCLSAATCAKGIPYSEGSTASVALIRGNHIIVGSVGDSRCVLSRNGQAMDLSTDHKPNLPDEHRRIQNAGGQVTRDTRRLWCAGQERVLLGSYRVNGLLAMSRSIGDFVLKSNSLSATEQMVTCNPDVRTVDITDDTEFLLIASDGIWDILSSQGAVDFVHQKLASGIPYSEGSTASVALISGNQIIVGNVGDSHCVLSRNGQAMDLSTDHKPNLPDESRRIQNAGGRVTGDRKYFMCAGEKRFQTGSYRVNGDLAMSRSIGDFNFKSNCLRATEQMVTCNPDIRTAVITDDTEFLLIASEGIWDMLSSQGAVNFVHQKLASGTRDLRTICEGLLDHCIKSKNNMTVILVQFKPAARIPLPAPPAAMPVAQSSASETSSGTSREINEDPPASVNNA